MKDHVARLFIFGANDYAQKCLGLLKKYDVRVAGIIDNNSEKQGLMVGDIYVYSPEIIREKADIEILIACRNFPAVVNQIESLGVRRDRIYLSPKEIITDAWGENDFEGNEKECVLIANGYDPFVHNRVKKYYEVGFRVTVIHYSEEYEDIMSYELDGIRIIKTGRSGLLYYLRKTDCNAILIHFMNYRMASVIRLAEKDFLPIIVWSHGYESLPWYRTWFEHSKEELEKKIVYYIENDKDKKRYLSDWFKKKNVAWIFVSEWHSRRVEKWIGYLPVRYRVIHNYIDEDYYNLPFPEKEDVINILSIRSHKSNIYANDVVANAILELSGRTVFEQLRFTLYGFGELFEDNFKELSRKNFPNVKIIEGKLTGAQMKDEIKNYGVFLAPTRYDSHGVTVAEMMAAGRCVITSSIPVMLELYDESCISFCEGDNPWSLADEIEYLVNHRDVYISKCHNARTVISHQCGYESTIKKELELVDFMRNTV